MTVYFVDEDYVKFGAWLVEAQIRRIDMVPIGDADTAFVQLTSSHDVELVVIDVMLSAWPSDSRFSVDRTDSYLRTGLALWRRTSLSKGDQPQISSSSGPAGL